MYSRVISTTAALFLIATIVFAGQDNNPPWYPSLQAFEHYDSGRSHVFSQAEFRGSYDGRNRVLEERSTALAYPSGYNTSYLNENEHFIQGGSYGDVSGSIGPFVAKVDRRTLDPVWFTQLRNTQEAGEWDYPGGMAIMNNGFIYVVSGYRMYRVNPADGATNAVLVLPTEVYLRNNYPTNPPTYDTVATDDAINTSYNGLNALPDGTIVLKSVYRVAGCTNEGGQALLACPNSRNVPQSVLVSVNPNTMQIITNITLPNPVAARPTISHYNGVDYVYLLENTTTPRRYSVVNGIFAFDDSWQPPAVTNCGQQPGGSLIVMNDWIVGAANSIFATEPLTVFAINQGNATNYFMVQPYVNDPVAPEFAAVFSSSALNGGSPLCTNVESSAINLPAVSWAGMSLEADAENGLFYGVETLARKVAAFRITPAGIKTVWKETQTTTEWATLIGPKEHRVWVGTDIPFHEIPGQNHTAMVVWRDARTGRELARSGLLPAMTSGSAVQPGYDGSMFFPGAEGTLIKLTPVPKRSGQGQGPRH